MHTSEKPIRRKKKHSVRGRKIDLGSLETYMERLHDPAGFVVVRLERQILWAPVARVVEHPTPFGEELPEFGRLGHLRPKPYLSAGLAELLPDHLQLLLTVVAKHNTHTHATDRCFLIPHTDTVCVGFSRALVSDYTSVVFCSDENVVSYRRIVHIHTML